MAEGPAAGRADAPADAADAPERLVDRSFRGARFERCDLSGAVLRGVDVAGADLDAPWLGEGAPFLVNGVDVTPLVEAALDNRFPGRSARRADTPEGLGAAWTAVERAWADAVARAEAAERARPGTLDAQVDGEFSFAQTLRHLVMATDVWLRRTVQGVEQHLHPLGQPHAEFARDGQDTSALTHLDGPAPWDDVLAARADRQAQVAAWLSVATAADLAQEHPHPWAPGTHRVTALHAVHTILGEEWEHLRFALRDLDALERAPGGVSPA